MCGNLLKFFTLSPAEDESGRKVWPQPEKWTTDVIGGPLPFECKIEVRGEKRRGVIEGLYCEAFE
jgi:hypothetical protein